jgi:hypothetical protein
MIDSENERQIAKDGEYEGAERIERAPLPNVVGLDAYRERSRSGGKTNAYPLGADNANGGVWERTSQQLLPEDAEDGRPAVNIVKVSSGFGKLRVPAWNNDIRCQAAA